MPSITAPTLRGLVVAYGRNVKALSDKIFNVLLITGAAPDLLSVSEWRALLGLDESLAASGADAPLIAPNDDVSRMAEWMERINENRGDLPAIFTDREIKDMMFAAGGLPPSPGGG